MSHKDSLTGIVNAFLKFIKFAYDAEELAKIEIEHDSEFFEKVGKLFRLKVSADITQSIISKLGDQFNPIFDSDFHSYSLVSDKTKKQLISFLSPSKTCAFSLFSKSKPSCARLYSNRFDAVIQSDSLCF